MNLSYSSISAYRKCPLSYKLQYVDKVPTKKTPALSFGSSIHSALEFMYNVPTPNPPSLEQVLGSLLSHWSSEGYADPIEEENYLEHAKRVVEQFYRANVADFKVPVVLEHKFFIAVDGVNLMGFIDRIDKLPSGGYEIIDYKTNKRLPPKSKVDDDLQLSIYHIAVEAIWGFAPELLSLYFVLPNQKLSSSRTERNVKETKRLILEVADDISKGKFEPVENNLCPWCDFRDRCPFFMDQFASPETGGSRDVDIRELVDRYIHVDKVAKEAKAELDELKSLINDFCTSKNLARVYGATGHVTRREMKRATYNMERLRQVLEPLGLWDGILRLDAKSLNQLLSWKDLQEEVRRGIEDAKEDETLSFSLYPSEAARFDGVKD
ncbi:MAG: RecB family exonuclease [Candidatus Aquicultorales bacterium]